MISFRGFLLRFRALEMSLSLKFVIGVAVVLTAAMGVSIYFIDRNHEKLVLEQVDQQARALFRQIVLTREWIADHGGIFTEKVLWKEPSPYLAEPELVDIQGRKYVKQTPAMVTKELSQYAREKGMYWFHITSLKLLNPENAPDDFERNALTEFESGRTKEISIIEDIESHKFYRYIAPLYIEETCLKCHSHQGYKTGDVRGAISVTVPMDPALSMIRSGRTGLVLASVSTIGFLMIVLYIMMKELVVRPVNQLKTSIEDFSKGRNTGTTVIKTGDELEVLSKSFVDMSHTLTEYHSELESRVQTATQSLKLANTRLTELNEKKSDFIAKISHELRTPMTSIKGAMDYLAVKVPGIAGSGKDVRDVMEFLDVIKKNADRLIRMVNDTLDLERIESGMYDLHITNVDMLALIKEVVISFQSVTSERGIIFEIKANPRVFVNADQDRIRQVLINLVSNAISFSPDNSEIHFDVDESDSAVIVTLTDEGPGIPSDVKKKIFDKFYTIGKRHGTGLGLAICKGIIEAHGGEINVLTDVETGNAIFFTLPKKGNE